MKKKKILEELIKIGIERQFNCGDGAGKPITSHTFRCRCDYLNGRETVLRKQLFDLSHET